MIHPFHYLSISFRLKNPMAEFEEFHLKFYGIRLKKIPNKFKFMIEFR